MMSIWGVRLAFCAVIIAAIAIGLFRVDMIGFRVPLLAVAASVLIAVIALLFSGIGIFNDVVSKTASVSPVLRGLAIIGALLLAVPGISALRSGMSSPPIHDVSTDPDDPPLFEFVMADRRASDNSLELDAAVIAQQREAYPELSSVRLPLPIDQAAEKIRAGIVAQGWNILGDRNLGADAASEVQIEAVARTRIFGFRDDLAFRLRSLGEAETLLDIRSASRVGISDLGANARRVTGFIDTLTLP